MPRTRWASVALFLVALVPASCSGGGDDKVATATSQSPTTLAPVTTLRPVDTSFTGQGSTAFCQLARSFSERFANVGVPSTPTEIRSNMREAQSAITQASNVAPAEIQADVRVVSAGFAELIAALERVNYDATRVEASFFTKLQQPDFVTSSQRLEAYLRNICRTG